MKGIEDGGDMKNEDTEQYSKQRKCDITVNKYVCMYRCMYVPMYNVCMYVCMYVCRCSVYPQCASKQHFVLIISSF